MTFGSLFTGIGGFDLGLERAGWECKWQCEIDSFCCKVLAKHWPGINRYGDVTKLDGRELASVDLVCGGFPCQPFSSASRGRRHGIADDRFLWPEMLRIVSIIKPSWILAENVAHLEGFALEQVVSDMEALGYEVAPPLEIPACAFGHDHKRTRLWFLGYANGDSQPSVSIDAEVGRLPGRDRDARGMGTAHGVSDRLDRLAALGNAIVPQVAEWIGRAILEVEKR